MKRNALIAGVAGFVVILLAWYFIVYSPIGDTLSTTKTSVAAEQGKEQSLQADLARLNSQQKSSTEQEALLRKFDQAIPKLPDLGEFIIQANNIADDAGIEFLSIAPSPPAASGASSTISLTINVSGSFFQIENYLTRLEKLDRLVIIDGLNMTTGGSDAASAGDTTLSVTLTGRMFTRAAPPGTPGSAVTTPATTPTTAPGSSTSSTTPASSTTGGT